MPNPAIFEKQKPQTGPCMNKPGRSTAKAAGAIVPEYYKRKDVRWDCGTVRYFLDTGNRLR